VEGDGMKHIVHNLGGDGVSGDNGRKWLNAIELPLWPKAERVCGDWEAQPCN